jgi:hypothetical protein
MTYRRPAPLGHLNLIEFIGLTICVIGFIWLMLL